MKCARKGCNNEVVNANNMGRRRKYCTYSCRREEAKEKVKEKKEGYLSNLDIDKGIKKCIFCGAELDIEDEYCDFCDAPQYKIDNEYED